MFQKSNLKDVVTEWKEAWEKHTGQTYYIQGKDIGFAVKIVEMEIDPDDYRERRDVYFNDKKWGELCNWSFAGFVNNINKFLPKRQEPIIGTYGQLRECLDCKKKYWTRLGHVCANQMK